MRRWRLICFGVVAISFFIYAIILYRISLFLPGSWWSASGWAQNFNLLFSSDFEKLGQFGDFVGGTLNSIFLVFSSILLIYGNQQEKAEAKKKELIESFDKLARMLDDHVNASVTADSFDGNLIDLLSKDANKVIKLSSGRFKESLSQCHTVQRYAHGLGMACETYIRLFDLDPEELASTVIFKSHFDNYSESLVILNLLSSGKRNDILKRLYQSGEYSRKNGKYKFDVQNSNLWNVYFGYKAV